MSPCFFRQQNQHQIATQMWTQQSHRVDLARRFAPKNSLAQGRPDALRWTCMLVCALFVHIAHETAGAARTRSSLRPLSGGTRKSLAKLGRIAPRECETMSTVIARSEATTCPPKLNERRRKQSIAP